jgi:hypothetical protein
MRIHWRGGKEKNLLARRGQLVRNLWHFLMQLPTVMETYSVTQLYSSTFIIARNNRKCPVPKSQQVRTVKCRTLSFSNFSIFFENAHFKKKG